jgi:hypothetical protein
MTGLNTYQRADGTFEFIHLHEVNALRTKNGGVEGAHAELARRLGFKTVEEFLAANGDNLKKVATPAATEAAI